jgi:hypothetical protein
METALCRCENHRTPYRTIHSPNHTAFGALKLAFRAKPRDFFKILERAAKPRLDFAAAFPCASHHFAERRSSAGALCQKRVAARGLMLLGTRTRPGLATVRRTQPRPPPTVLRRAACAALDSVALRRAITHWPMGPLRLVSRNIARRGRASHTSPLLQNRASGVFLRVVVRRHAAPRRHETRSRRREAPAVGTRRTETAPPGCAAGRGVRFRRPPFRIRPVASFCRGRCRLVNRIGRILHLGACCYEALRVQSLRFSLPRRQAPSTRP